MSQAPFAALRDWFTQSGFRRDAAVLFTSTALARGVLIVTMPLVARAFAPDEVGSWQLFVSVATVLGVIACWRYELAIPLPSDDAKARDLVRLSMLVAVGMSALLALVILCFREPFSRWVASPALERYVWLVPPFVLCIGCEQAASYWLTRTGAFTRQGVSRLLKSALGVGLPLALAPFLDANAGLLITGSVLGQAAATVFLLERAMWRNDAGSSPEPRLTTRLRAALAEFRNYPLYVAPYAFISQFAKRLVYFLLASFASSDAVGFFSMAMQITLVPVTFVTSALNQAFYRRAGSSGDLRPLEPLVVKVLRLQVVVALPAFVLLVLHARLMLGFVLGPRWQETADYVSWLAAPSMMLFLTAWLDRVFDALGRQRLAVILQLCYDAVSLAILASLLAMGHTPLVAIATYSVATALYNMLWLAITFHIARFSLRPLGRIVLRAAALVGALLVLHFTLRGHVGQVLALTLEALFAILMQALVLGLTRSSPS